MIRQTLSSCSASWHKCSIYEAGMQSIVARSTVVGSVDNLIDIIINKKFNKKVTSRFFIEFFHDFQELKEKESIFDKEYNIVTDPSVLSMGVFRIIGNDDYIRALIIASRFAKKGSILLMEDY